MNILRRFTVAVCAVLFFFSSIGLAWSHVFSRSLANRDEVKSWLSDGNFYDNIVDVVLESLANVDSQEAGEIPVNDPALQAKVREVFTPDFLKTNTEIVLDGVYNWLEGKTDQPDFKIDLTQTRLQIASALGDYAVTRGASLPVCTEVPADFDALSATCLPPGYSVASLKAQVENTLLNESTFIDEPIITADTLKGEDQQTNLFENTEAVRRVFNTARALPIVLGVLTVLTAVGIVLLSDSRRSGFLRLGIMSTITAVLLGVGYLALDQGPTVFKPDVIGDKGAQNQAAQELATGMFETFAQDNKKLIALYAVAFGLVAAASYTGYATLNRRQDRDSKEDESKEPKPPVDDSPKSDADKPAEKSADKPVKPAKQPPKIQL